jgi:hypothetical protein
VPLGLVHVMGALISRPVVGALCTYTLPARFLYDPGVCYVLYVHCWRQHRLWHPIVGLCPRGCACMSTWHNGCALQPAFACSTRAAPCVATNRQLHLHVPMRAPVTLLYDCMLTCALSPNAVNHSCHPARADGCGLFVHMLPRTVY